MIHENHFFAFHLPTACLLPLVLFFLWLTAGPVAAQSYTIDWYKISGGGGSSSSGQYTLTGTIGQPDAGGTLSGGNFSLTGGFWAIISLVQTPGAPVLHIAHDGRQVTVFWQDVAGWGLQQNSSLKSPAGWTANASSTNSNGTNYLTLPSPSGNLFFRLTGP